MGLAPLFPRLLVVAGAALCLSAAPALGTLSATPKPIARAALTITATDSGHLHLVSSPGSELFEEGTASGTLPGKLKVRFDIAPVITASFVIYAKGGTIKGGGSGKLKTAGLYSTFAGSLKITGGTGRYSHARGSGSLRGALNRETYALSVQTSGTISF